MGGAGPYVKFTPTVNLRRSSLQSVTSAAEAYELAKPFLLRWKAELLSEHQYEEHVLPPCHDSAPILLFAISNPSRYYYSAGSPRVFKLPHDPQTFASNDSSWERNFTSLHAKRPNRGSVDLFLDEAPPLQNIFYLLQTILDGMLSIVREDDIDDYGEETTTRVLPRKEWIRQNSDIVKGILGLPSTDALEEDAEKHGILIHHEGHYSCYSDEDKDLDFTACDRECGYCGKCDY